MYILKENKVEFRYIVDKCGSLNKFNNVLEAFFARNSLFDFRCLGCFLQVNWEEHEKRNVKKFFLRVWREQYTLKIDV